MKLSANLFATVINANSTIYHEPIYNIAVTSEPIIFYNDAYDIETTLVMRSLCSTLEDSEVHCGFDPSYSNDYAHAALQERKNYVVSECTSINGKLLELHMQKSSNGRSRRSDIIEFGKKFITEVSPLTANAIELLTEWTPKAYQTIKKMVTEHKNRKSHVVIDKSKHKVRKAKEEICADFSRDTLVREKFGSKTSFSSQHIMAETLATSNFRKIEQVFLAIQHMEFETSPELEELILKTCAYRLPKHKCEQLFDLAAIKIEPTALKMSKNGDTLLQLRVQIPKSIHDATIYKIHSNGRFIDGNLETLKVADRIVSIGQHYYDATNIQCKNNLKKKVCITNVLSQLGCEKDIIQFADASKCPVIVTKWDENKPVIYNHEQFVLLSSTETCDMCTRSKVSIDETCSRLERQSIITNPGIIKCQKSHVTRVSFINVAQPQIQTLKIIPVPAANTTILDEEYVIPALSCFSLIMSLFTLLSLCRAINKSIQRLHRNNGKNTDRSIGIETETLNHPDSDNIESASIAINEITE